MTNSVGRYRSSGAKQRRKRALVFLVTVLFLIFSVGYVLVDWRVRPMIQTYGNNQAVTAATRSVNAAVEQVLSQQTIHYEDLAVVTKDSEGNVISIETNTASTNLLKSAIGEAVLQKLDDQSVQTVKIPLGSLVGGLLTGRGPSVRIKVPMDSTVETTFVNVFEGAGINQTRHEITIHVKVSLYTIIQGENTATQVETGFTVAETILVGEVPQWVAGTVTNSATAAK